METITPEINGFGNTKNNQPPLDNKKIAFIVSFILLLLLTFSGIYYFFIFKRPDLMVTNLTANVHAEKAKKIVQLDYTITNSGRVNTLGNITINTLENGQLISSENLKGLKINEEFKFSKTIEKRDSGNFLYEVNADPDKKISDLNRPNNKSSSILMIPADLPDLEIKDVSFNGITMLNITYCNNWTGTSDEKFQIKVATVDGIYNGNPYFPLSVPAPGECITPYVLVDEIGVHGDEIKDVKIQLDTDKVIKELNKDNNSFEGSIDFHKSVKCVDTDGGKNYYQAGTASTPNTGGFLDCCYTDRYALFSTRCSDEGPYLGEAYCNTQNEPKRDDIFECPKGCKDGACVN
jgi:hypothetical protein